MRRPRRRRDERPRVRERVRDRRRRGRERVGRGRRRLPLRRRRRAAPRHPRVGRRDRLIERVHPLPRHLRLGARVGAIRVLASRGFPLRTPRLLGVLIRESAGLGGGGGGASAAARGARRAQELLSHARDELREVAARRRVELQDVGEGFFLARALVELERELVDAAVVLHDEVHLFQIHDFFRPLVHDEPAVVHLDADDVLALDDDLARVLPRHERAHERVGVRLRDERIEMRGAGGGGLGGRSDRRTGTTTRASQIRGRGPRGRVRLSRQGREWGTGRGWATASARTLLHSKT